MTTQSEQQLEETLMAQSKQLGFAPVVLADTAALVANLKVQLGKFNETVFSDEEFASIGFEGRYTPPAGG